MSEKGRIFIVSAPSGCGKTTICERVLKRAKGLARSVSATTRPPRRDEKKDTDYHYASPASFGRGIKKGRFLEWEKNFGHFYGTPKRFVLDSIKKGNNVLLSIDVKGAMKIRKKFPASVLIFIKPPSMKELARRLRGRRTDGGSEIAKRLKIAKKELKMAEKYDYTVVNRNLKSAVKEILSIIKKEG